MRDQGDGGNRRFGTRDGRVAAFGLFVLSPSSTVIVALRALGLIGGLLTTSGAVFGTAVATDSFPPFGGPRHAVAVGSGLALARSAFVLGDVYWEVAIEPLGIDI